MTFRPERLQASHLLIFWRLIRYYWSQGWAAWKFFFGSLWRTLRQVPRVTGQMAIYLGMYVHFLEIHRRALAWDPWSRAESNPRTFDEDLAAIIPPFPARRTHREHESEDFEAVAPHKAA